MFKSLGVDLDIPLTITPLSFEYLNIHERTILLSLLDRIMKIPCDLIVDRAYEYGISNASFWDNRKKLPSQLLQMKAAMAKPVRIYPSQRLKSSINQPKSKKNVERKWLKLLRKIKKLELLNLSNKDSRQVCNGCAKTVLKIKKNIRIRNTVQLVMHEFLETPLP